MNRIVIYNSKVNFCDISDPFCRMVAEYEQISGMQELIDRLKAGGVDAVVFDAESTDDECLAYIKNLNISPDSPKTAVYISGKNDLRRFAEAGINNFFTDTSMHSGIKQLIKNKSSRYTSLMHKAVGRMKELAECVEHGIIVFDEAEKVYFANNAAMRILDMTSADLNRKTLNEIFLMHPYSGSAERFDEQPHTTRKGRELILSSTLTVTRDNEDTSGSILIFYPVSASSIDRQKELELLKYQERYHSTQQTAAFRKQMLVIKDEVSGTKGSRFFFETYFKPLDIMSGDIYGNMNLKDGRYFLYIIDAMGKGLSASVTALQSSSFINHAVELSIIKNDFEMSKILSSFLHYIRDRLMEDEALCAVFAMIDTNTDTISVSSFGMPPILACMKDGTVQKIRTPNMPIMRFMAVKEVTDFSLKDVDKLLIYSDGLTESFTRDGSLYNDRLPDAFRRAATKKHLLKMVNSDVIHNDDDITFYFISSEPSEITASDSFTVKSGIRQLSMAAERISAFMEARQIDHSEISTFEFAVNEMLMNALEHGSLGISFRQKQELIRGGIYDEFIEQRTEETSDYYNKEISVHSRISVNEASGNRLLTVEISDTGTGFNVPEIFKFNSFDGNLFRIETKEYNGRGIFITDNLVDGLFYSDTGNTVYIIKVIE